MCCVGWLRSGTNTKQTLLLSVATLASKRSKDNALQTGGGHAEAPPTRPFTSETNEAKMGAEKEKTKHGSTKIKQIQTSMENKLLREGAKKEREKRDIYEVFLFFGVFVLYRRVEEDATEITLMMLFFYLLGPLPPSSFKL